MGHSWGTIVGVRFIQKYPEQVKAYIGVSQVINMLESDQLAYDFLLKTIEDSGNDEDLKTLENLQPFPEMMDKNYWDKFLVFRTLQSKYGMAGDYLKQMEIRQNSPYATKEDLTYYEQDYSKYQNDNLEYAFNGFDARNFSLQFNIPVFLISGQDDLLVSHDLSQQYNETIQAPIKMFYSVENVGHEPFADNKEEFTRILIYEILPQIS